MFFPGSRYIAIAQYQARRPDGSMVRAVRIPLPGPAAVIGYFRRSDGQRLDTLANYFLADATAFWRLCDANNSMVPDSLAGSDLIGIPFGARAS